MTPLLELPRTGVSGAAAWDFYHGVSKCCVSTKVAKREFASFGVYEDFLRPF